MRLPARRTTNNIIEKQRKRPSHPISISMSVVPPGMDCHFNPIVSKGALFSTSKASTIYWTPCRHRCREVTVGVESRIRRKGSYGPREDHARYLKWRYLHIYVKIACLWNGHEEAVGGQLAEMLTEAAHRVSAPHHPARLTLLWRRWNDRCEE